MKYLVFGSEGPGFASSEEAVHLLEKLVLPSFDVLMRLEEQNKILAGGLPVGDRPLYSSSKLSPTRSWTGCCWISRCGAYWNGRSRRFSPLQAGHQKTARSCKRSKEKVSKAENEAGNEACF